tara:strand:- start:175 stop:618 length:444 start_codon:yes stop_codon:yes gene_type:complete
MAVRDTSKKPYIADRDTNVFVGIDYPFRKSEGVEGWFASTESTLAAVKQNVKMLLSTSRGERYMQPNLGLNLRRFLFEPFTDDIRIAIENEIVDGFQMWLPFVEIRDIKISTIDDQLYGKNTIGISVIFNIVRDPSSLESVQVNIGE